MNNAILHINNIECGYGSNIVLRNIELLIKKGEFAGIIGPNAAGKTTLLRAITNVVPLRKGNVKLRGIPTSKLSRRDIAKDIAVVSQTREDMFFNMIVEETVLLGRIPHFGKYQWIEKKEDRKIAEEAMLLTDIIDLRNRGLESLSGGEKQRVFIARALAQKPKLLLLDEPTSHLDITHQVGILDLIKKLNKEFGLTVIMVLHDLNLASEYCHHLVLLSEGRVFKMGHPEEVMDYKTIEKVYKTIVVIEKNPVSSKPHIFVVSEDERKSNLKTE